MPVADAFHSHLGEPWFGRTLGPFMVPPTQSRLLHYARLRRSSRYRPTDREHIPVRKYVLTDRDRKTLFLLMVEHGLHQAGKNTLRTFARIGKTDDTLRN